jgi:hypothetical protein
LAFPVRKRSPAEAGWGAGGHQNHQLKLVAKVKSLRSLMVLALLKIGSSLAFFSRVG